LFSFWLAKAQGVSPLPDFCIDWRMRFQSVSGSQPGRRIHYKGFCDLATKMVFVLKTRTELGLFLAAPEGGYGLAPRGHIVWWLLDHGAFVHEQSSRLKSVHGGR
jgi:hypothetical protein